MRVGDLEIHLISDGVIHADAGGPFGLVPRTLYERFFPIGSDNSVQMRLTCLLVRSHDKTILIDTGIGDKLSEKDKQFWNLQRLGGGLVDNLAKVGVAPHDVDMVVNTHFHGDHCGGNTRWNDDRVEAVFPNARYYVQRMEWASASNPDIRTERTYAPENFTPLMKQGRLLVLHGDTSLTDQVSCVVTPGHTRGHQSVILHSGDWWGLFMGDMASYAVQMMRAAWLTAYDEQPLENLATKLHWQKWALEKDAWLFVEHDPSLPVIRLIQDGKRLKAQPVTEAQELIDELPTLPPLP